MTNHLLLGCIADDFTGASDLANTLAREGMSTTQLIGIPPQGAACHAEAAVISLKSRSISTDDAINQSLQALAWLQQQGARQILFKYCSTFDSTPEGNIGPVAEALANALNTNAVVVCPAFPTTGRTVYQGHLFVFDKLLNESGLENHPLNPMTDADLRRWLARQSSAAPSHIDQSVVSAGSAAIESALTSAAANGDTLVVVDAVADDDLRAIGRACVNAKLVTGGSGIALGLPQNFRERGLLSEQANNFTAQQSAAAILCGSCSETSRQQIKAYNGPLYPVDVPSLMDGTVTADSVAAQLPADTTPLIYSSADPATISQLQSTYSAELLAQTIENFFGDLAVVLVRQGVRRLVVAGGETSGAVISALQLTAFDIGPEIDPGVPALSTVNSGTINSGTVNTGKGINSDTTDEPTLAVALKSGNFGSEHFFTKALSALGTAP